jgi:hypothetical protein
VFEGVLGDLESLEHRASGEEALIRASETFNRSSFSRFINSPAGRVFRLVAGMGFLVAGVLLRSQALGWAALAWSVLPLSAGAFDLCYISAVLGGPLSGAKIRAAQHAVAP